MKPPSFLGVANLKDEPLVQIILVTINGTRYALVGPVVHVPGLVENDIDVSEIEFGEVMTACTAARMLEGDFQAMMGFDVQ